MRFQSFQMALLAAALAVPAAAAGQDERPERMARQQVERPPRPPKVRVERYQRSGREEQTERFTKTVRVGADGELDIANISGDIIVSRGSGTDATIDVVKSARAATVEAAKEMLKLVEVDITERGGRAEAHVNYGRTEGGRWNRWRDGNVTVAFTVTAPAGTRLSAKSISGDIRVKDLKGELSAETISGQIQIAGAGRVSVAKSISGDVEIVETQGQGPLDASSASGAVTLRKVKVTRLDAQSVSGNVVLADVDCERADVQSMSGDVRYEGPLARNGRYELKSHSGEVRVVVSGGSGFEVNANTFSGNVRSDFALKTESSDRGPLRRQSVRGAVGDGSAVLELNTFSGNIALTKK